MLLKQTGIRISNRQQINSDQNFRALFGKKGQKRLNDLFNPCCSTVKFINVCVSYNGTKIPLCAVPFPACQLVEEAPTSPPTNPQAIEFTTLTEFLASLSVSLNRTVYTDGCNVVIIANANDDTVYNTCIPLVSCSSFSSGDITDTNIILTDFTVEDGTPDFLRVVFACSNFPVASTSLNVETSVDGLIWHEEGTTSCGGSPFDFAITATSGATLYVRIVAEEFGVVSNVLSVIIP